mmetsp:Transcript_25545/g.51142  ORF Transcript_25545/g.51142 Transcript_25545/m.51142 type:complete len:325 (+) Transcript_25545:50-1024(+)
MPRVAAKILAVPHPEDIEEVAPAPPNGEVGVFDGYWVATFADGSIMKLTTVCISGAHVWHRREEFAKFKQVTGNTCAIMMRDEDVKGRLSDDAEAIAWEDGDCWRRARPRSRRARPADDGGAVEIGVASVPGQDDGDIVRSPPCEGVPAEAAAVASIAPRKAATEAAAAAATAVLRREWKALHDALETGAPVESEVDPVELWRELRWDAPAGAPPRTSLLAACILLQWPEGVALCVQRGADVNATYEGPLRSADGFAQAGGGVPLLRAAVSAARGPTQSTIVQHLLGGRVRCKTVQAVRRKMREEMELVTAQLIDRFDGPFLGG